MNKKLFFLVGEEGEMRDFWNVEEEDKKMFKNQIGKKI